MELKFKEVTKETGSSWQHWELYIEDDKTNTFIQYQLSCKEKTLYQWNGVIVANGYFLYECSKSKDVYSTKETFTDIEKGIIDEIKDFLESIKILLSILNINLQ